MNTRLVLNVAIAVLLASTVVMAGGLIWLATAEPEVLASVNVQRGWAGVVLTVAGRAFAAIW